MNGEHKGIQYLKKKLEPMGGEESALFNSSIQCRSVKFISRRLDLDLRGFLQVEHEPSSGWDKWQYKWCCISTIIAHPLPPKAVPNRAL